MNDASLQPVSPGQKVQADTINKIIQSTDFSLKTTGAMTHIGKDVNIQVLNPGQNDFSGQKFREPFDLSVSQTEAGIQYTVLRPELYLWGSYRSIKNDLTVQFPSENDQHVGIYITCDAGCSPDSYGLAMMEASETVNFMVADDGPSLQAAEPKLKRITGIKPSWKTTPKTIRDTWSKVGRYALQNPIYKGDGSLSEPGWRKYLSRPIKYDKERDTVLPTFWDKEKEASEVLNTPGGATETDVTVDEASEYDDTGDKYASSPHAWLIWQFMPNGTIVEDSRSMAIPAAEDMYFKSTRPTKLDLSSLNWKVEYPTDPNLSAKYAQNFHYDAPRPEDLVDLKNVKADAQTSTAEISTCVDKWRFLVRPEEGIGNGTLHYASLSTVLSAISGEGGGGGGGTGGACSCDLSVTPPDTLSSLGQNLVKVAAWTKDKWQTQVDILAPDTAKDIVTMANRLAYTPFYLRIRYNNGAPIMDIINNFFFYGRDMKTLQNYSVTQTGTYYLEIETNQYGYYISRIVREASTSIPPAIKQNDDTHTYYPLWVVTSLNPTWDTGFPFDCRSMYITPFYSN